MVNNINLLDLENNSDECMICKENLNSLIVMLYLNVIISSIRMFNIMV